MDGGAAIDPSGGQGQSNDNLATGLLDAPEADLGRKVMRDISDSKAMVQAWRGLAKQDFAFYHSHQWDDVDRLRMEQLKRPALVFNRLKATVDAVSGIERLSRMDVRFVTRALDSSYEEDLLGDLATEAWETALDLCDGPRARSRALLDTLIGGMGWVSIGTKYDRDIDGRVVLERIDPMECYWDQNAVSENLTDASWVAHERRLPRKMFGKLWGDDKLAAIDYSDPTWNERDNERYELVTPYYSRQNEMANPLVNNTPIAKSIPVIRYLWRDYAPVYRFLDPSNPDHLTKMDEKGWTALKKKCEILNRPCPDAVKQLEPVYKQVYVSRGVQLEEPTTIPGNYFSLLCITGQWDTETKTWYGVIRPLLDAQRTRNKAISNSLSIFLGNSKGGTLYKTSAFADPIRAKEDWASPNAWIEVQDTADIDRDIKQRQPGNVPVELGQFFGISTAEIAGISGINDEMIGVAQGDAPTSANKQRLQQALAVLGWFFDAVAGHMPTEARVTLEFIREFWTHGQLIQVGGQTQGRAIPLFRSGLPLDYEMVVDQSVRHNPNLKAQIWQDLLPILPAFMRFGYGSFLLEILKFSPYPAQLVERLQKMAMQQPPQQPGKGRGKQADPQEVQAKVAKIGADAQKSLAQARAIDQESRLRVPELMLDALAQRSQDQHKRGLEDHKRRQDLLKAIQVLQHSRNGGMGGMGGL